jgi:catalase
LRDDKLRGKPEKFADHYTQATLFWESQSAVEQAHIVEAFRFELTKVQTPAIRVRMVAGLMNVAEALASRVAQGLGIELPQALPRILAKPARPEVKRSEALSLLARPGDGSIRSRRIALLVEDGMDSPAFLRDALQAAGATPVFIGHRLGPVQTNDGDAIEPEVTFETAPAVLFDAMVLPGGLAVADALISSGQALEFVRTQYRHCKAILALYGSSAVLEAAGIPPLLPDGTGDPGVLVVSSQDRATVAEAFIRAIARHRHFERQLDPPAV